MIEFSIHPRKIGKCSITSKTFKLKKKYTSIDPQIVWNCISDFGKELFLLSLKIPPQTNLSKKSQQKPLAESKKIHRSPGFLAPPKKAQNPSAAPRNFPHLVRPGNVLKQAADADVVDVPQLSKGGAKVVESGKAWNKKHCVFG